MSDQTSASGHADDPHAEPEEMDDRRVAEMMRAVMREQERHREGGVDPELDDADADPGPDA